MIVNELSDIFDVSETFILKRIRELGLEEESNEKTIWNLLKNFRFAE